MEGKWHQCHWRTAGDWLSLAAVWRGSIGVAESGLSSEFHRQQALHNDFVTKMFVSTHNLGQTTNRNKSRRTHQGAEQFWLWIARIPQSSAKPRNWIGCGEAHE